MAETSHDNRLNRRLPIVSCLAIGSAVSGFALLVYAIYSDPTGETSAAGRLTEGSTLFLVLAVLTGFAGFLMSVKSRDRSLKLSHAGLILALAACVPQFFVTGMLYSFLGNDQFFAVCGLGVVLSLALIVIIMFLPVIPRPPAGDDVDGRAQRIREPLLSRKWIGLLVFAGYVGIIGLYISVSWYASQLSPEERQAIAEIKKLGGRVASTTYASFPPQATDADLVRLKSLPQLKSLILDNTQVTDAGLVHLTGLTKLHTLSLDNAQITDAGLEHLTDLRNLQDLRLNRTQITDAGLEKLKTLTNLQQLFLGFTQITDVGLAHLQGMTNLQRLYLFNTQVTDAGLVHLKGLTKLQSLWLDSTEITDAGLVHLNGLTGLQTLLLEHTQITDAGLVHLKGLTKLRTLRLTGTQITDEGLVHLKGLIMLWSLTLNGTPVTDEGIKDLKEALPNCTISH